MTQTSICPVTSREVGANVEFEKDLKKCLNNIIHAERLAINRGGSDFPPLKDSNPSYSTSLIVTPKKLANQKNSEPPITISFPGICKSFLVSVAGFLVRKAPWATIDGAELQIVQNGEKWELIGGTLN